MRCSLAGHMLETRSNANAASLMEKQGNGELHGENGDYARHSRIARPIGVGEVQRIKMR